MSRSRFHDDARVRPYCDLLSNANHPSKIVSVMLMRYVLMGRKFVHILCLAIAAASRRNEQASDRGSRSPAADGRIRSQSGYD